MKFSDIITFPRSAYSVTISWKHLENHIANELEMEPGLNLNPFFQREHVWTIEQQSLYCEYILRGGTSGKDLYFNCPGFGLNNKGPYEIVDGKQRLNAVRQFLNNKVKVFGQYHDEFGDDPDFINARFTWNVAAIDNRKDVLEWYINFNSGGTPHSKEELEKVKRMIREL